MGKRVKVKFKKKAAKQFRKNKPKSLRRVTRKKFCRELEYYIRSHEQAGKHFDAECQTIVYDENVVVMLRNNQGTWMITEVMVYGSITTYHPVFVWKLVKIGYRIIPVQFFAVWRIIRSTSLS